MPFLDDEINLQSTVFDQENLNWARQYLVNSIRFLDEDWLPNPTGPLGGMWAITRGTHAASFLIHFAQIMRDIDRATAASSVPVLHRKLRAILRPANGQSFEDDMTELEFGGHMASYASPIFFEPLALNESRNDANRQRSPDYALYLPGGLVYFEVTRPTFGFINAWDIGAEEAAEAIRIRLWRRGLRRAIQFRAPITASREDLKLLHSRDVLDAIERDTEGARQVRLSMGEARIEWRCIPEHPADAGPGSFPAPFSIISADAMPGPAVAMSYKPTIDNDLEERVVASIRSSLNKKKGQLTREAPYLIVARIGQLNKDAVMQTIFRRILRNPLYSWITGILVFEPMRDWSRTSPAAQIELLVNQNARIAATPELLSLLRGERQYHWRRRESQATRPARSEREQPS